MIRQHRSATPTHKQATPANPATAHRNEPQPSRSASAWQQYRRHHLAVLGSLVLVVILLSVVCGPFVYTTPFDRVDFAVALQGPSLAHPFGTNDLGQDMLARVLWGGRISVTVGMISMVVAISLGTLIGALAGFFGGLLDAVLMRVTDMFLALPTLPLLLLIVYLFRKPITTIYGPEIGMFLLIVVVIGGLNWMSVARLVRASFLVLRDADFVLAARTLGVPSARIIWRHMLPNALGPVIVAASLAVGAAIVTESTLSFLGLGFPPDTPTWGRMLFDAQNFVEFSPSMAIFPGLFIFLTVLSINAIGDGLRDALNPQLRKL